MLFLTSESNSRRWQRRGSPYDPIDKLTISFFCMQYLLKINVESKPRFAVRYEK